jgi:uncharacterized protein (DUF736 family)
LSGPPRQCLVAYGRFYANFFALRRLCAAAIEPVEKHSDKSPDYRVTNGDAEIGVAWKETGKAGNADLSVQFDAPTLPASNSCALIKTGIEHSFTFMWERPLKCR